MTTSRTALPIAPARATTSVTSPPSGPSSRPQSPPAKSSSLPVLITPDHNPASNLSARTQAGSPAPLASSRAEGPPQPGGRHRRPRPEWLTPTVIAQALFAASVVAALLWGVLEAVALDQEWHLYSVVWSILACWVPYSIWMVDSAWREDRWLMLQLGIAIGRITGWRGGYSEGYSDCLEIATQDRSGRDS
jgi:hypothetical protein